MSDLISEQNQDNNILNSLPYIEYSEDTFKRKMEEWRLILRKIDSFELKAYEVPIHAFLKYWVGAPSFGLTSNKGKLLEAIIQDKTTAKEIENLAQSKLRNEGKNSVVLYRGIKGLIDSDNVKLSAWDSLSQNKEFATISANPNLDYGWKQGTLLEIEVPIENIFTYYEAHPAFNHQLPEKEFILNEKGIEGAKLIKIDDRQPFDEEIKKLKISMPNLNFNENNPN